MKPRALELVAPRAVFRDRADAGRMLARSLSQFHGAPGLIVLGLARGGVPVARQVADALDAPLGVVVARKIGVPGIEDVALAAIAEGNHRVVADSVAWYLGVPSRVIDRLATRELAELERKVRLYGAGLSTLDLRGRTVILVDDGLATGATFRAAIAGLREKRPATVIAAVPIASRPSAEDVRPEVDELVAVVTPPRFDTVSAAYEDYSPVGDHEVLMLLGRTTRRAPSKVSDISERRAVALTRTHSEHSAPERTIGIPAFDATVVGDLGLPRPSATATARHGHRADHVRGLVILAHGVGGGRSNYLDRYIAGRLRLAGYATLRLDLLTAEEQRADQPSGSLRWDVDRVATRLACACEWVDHEGVPGAHRTTLLGSGASGAAALLTAARRPGRVFAVAARGGRLDLAPSTLAQVRTPVMLIVGASDREALRRSSVAVEHLRRGAVLIRVPNVGWSFEEPGAVGAVAEHAVSWLERLEARQQYGDKWHA